jgi:chromosome segregation protein
MLREYDEMTARMFDEYGLTRNEAEAVSQPCEKPGEARKELSEVKSKIKALGSVNVGAIEEYKEVGQRYEFMSAQISDVEKSRAELYKLIGTLTDTMKEMFVEGFNKINENFKTIFTSLFGGGSAELVLTEPDNILTSGIDIKAKLPGKNVPSLDGLSGGEKALVAIAIYFSAMKVNAPAFCILDEIDTALDEANVSLVAEYIKNSGIPTQFICITHRRGTMEASDMLYGITMPDRGISKVLSMNVNEVEKKMGGELN